MNKSQTGQFLALTFAAGAFVHGLTASPGHAAPGITLEGSFTVSNGAIPIAALTAADDGLYYGTALSGGANDFGSIYSFHPVPGPLPLLGVGAAFHSSRRLRRRLKTAQAVRSAEV